MNYELAKELKDAGFPQGVKFGSMVYDWKYKESPELIVLNDGCWSPECECPSFTFPPDDYLKDPSLLELIEACGGRYFALVQDGYGWKAFNNPDPQSTTHLCGYGPTPEEAVAKLWIALNKK